MQSLAQEFRLNFVQKVTVIMKTTIMICNKKFAFQRQIGENMEKEIKIDLVPKEQINEDFDCVRITCENICVWANCLESAIKAFDEALRQHR